MSLKKYQPQNLELAHDLQSVVQSTDHVVQAVGDQVDLNSALPLR